MCVLFVAACCLPAHGSVGLTSVERLPTILTGMALLSIWATLGDSGSRVANLVTIDTQCMMLKGNEFRHALRCHLPIQAVRRIARGRRRLLVLGTDGASLPP